MNEDPHIDDRSQAGSLSTLFGDGSRYPGARHPAEAISTVSEVSDESTRYDAAFFPGAQHFVVNGGYFTSNIFNSPHDVPSEFRRIPLGDVDLRHEIRIDASGGVHWQGARACARKIYSARIQGIHSDMTVAVYQGENAEERWKRDVAQHSGSRHPNFVQLFGIVSASGLYATIFHDELVPVTQYIEEYGRYMVSTVYLCAHFTAELNVPSQTISSFSLFNDFHRMQWSI
ncbi:hypothetical protein B0H11DRAFT_1363077 [Mycena galericulata]|nr:hypothetical protein B0H11DRAFT_1363077 [Mycena galericulata]